MDEWEKEKGKKKKKSVEAGFVKGPVRKATGINDWAK